MVKIMVNNKPMKNVTLFLMVWVLTCDNILIKLPHYDPLTPLVPV